MTIRNKGLSTLSRPAPNLDHLPSKATGQCREANFILSPWGCDSVTSRLVLSAVPHQTIALKQHSDLHFDFASSDLEKVPPKDKSTSLTIK